MNNPDRFIGANPDLLERPLHWLNRGALAKAEANACRIAAISMVLEGIAETYWMIANVARQAELCGHGRPAFDTAQAAPRLSGKSAA